MVTDNKEMNFPTETLSSELSKKEDKQSRFLFVNSVHWHGVSESQTCRRGETRTHLFFILFSEFETHQRFSLHLRLSTLKSFVSLRCDLSCRASRMLYLEMASEAAVNISSTL